MSHESCPVAGGSSARRGPSKATSVCQLAAEYVGTPASSQLFFALLIDVEITGLVGTVVTLADRSVHILDSLHTSIVLFAENERQRPALAQQQRILRGFIKELHRVLERAPAAELDALGPVWACALLQLDIDMTATSIVLNHL